MRNESQAPASNVQQASGSVHVTNAIVKDAWVSLDNGWCLSVWLHLDYDGTCQGFGGYVLGGDATSSAGKRHATGPNYAAEFLVRSMQVCGVDRLDLCKGKAIRVRKTSEYGDIIAIGHITKDIWFAPKATFESWKGGGA